MGRPFDRHIDSKELDALVPWSSVAGQERHEPPPEAVREAQRHLASCADCRAKVLKYRQLVDRLSHVLVTAAAPPGAHCPKDDVDWHEVAAGVWPELKATQLIMHAALCDHCGPLLRAAMSVDDDPTPREARLLAELKAPSRPESIPPRVPPPPSPRRFVKWLVPALALMIMVGVLITRPPSSPAPLSGLQFSEFAVGAHRQYAQGKLALDLRSDSQQTLNDWLKVKSPFSLALPTSPALPGEERPYRLQGARLVQVSGKAAAFIAYQMPMGPVSLVVTPDGVALASGGVQVDYKNVSFHYRRVEGYRVVTWSLHGNTYALVSQEGNSTQQSCMVCHSAMRDRDLSHTPAPLPAENDF